MRPPARPDGGCRRAPHADAPSRPLSVGAALAEARAAGVDRLDAQLLLSHHLGRPRAWLLAHDEATLAEPQVAAWRAHLMRRARGEPLAYLTGWREFHGLALQVTPDVLIPRPDTETLVDWAIELLGTAFERLVVPRVIDLGTGSGAIALAVKHRCPRAQVLAADCSAEALEVARGNAQRLGLTVTFACGDWWQATRTDGWQLALANPPYIAAGDSHLAALQHEPPGALSPGRSGLEALQQLAAGAPQRLAPGGWLLLEHGHDQGLAVRRLLALAGFADVETRTDLAGLERCTGGRWPGTPQR